jgi:hypothetical protein
MGTPGLGQSGFNSQQGQEFYLFRSSSPIFDFPILFRKVNVWRTFQDIFKQTLPWALTLRLKRLEREIDHYPTYNTKF